MTDVRTMTRNERLLSLISRGEISIEALEYLFDCPAASIRRSIQELRDQGYYITLIDGQVKNFGRRSALIAEQSTERDWVEIESANIGGDDDADYQR